MHVMATTTTRQSAEERREQVLEAATHEFAQRGYHAASTAAIAKRAGISQPYIYALSYFSLGDEHVEESKHSIVAYYSYLGGGEVGFAESLPRTPEAIRERQEQFEEAGVDEVVWDPTVPNVDQVDLLADAVL